MPMTSLDEIKLAIKDSLKNNDIYDDCSENNSFLEIESTLEDMSCLVYC